MGMLGVVGFTEKAENAPGGKFYRFTRFGGFQTEAKRKLCR
jgi:hypothetical protein